ncbi:MAG: MFS transporter, partial [Chloroflexota bacterium]
MPDNTSAAVPTEDKLDFRRVGPVLFIVFIDLMGLTILIPILPYYALSFNAGTAVIGMLVASYPLMQFISGPILGALSDRFGRKPVLAIAQVGTFLSLLMLGFANALWMIFL